MRSEALSDLPTVGEFVPGYENERAVRRGAPKGTPCAVIDKTHKEMGAGLADPKMKARFADLRSATMPMSPAELGKFIADETEKWAKVIRMAKPQAGLIPCDSVFHSDKRHAKNEKWPLLSHHV
jgi:tripartite-type tricarboxylate transporter receptor subunit TctC